jgi:hypothetical protein
MICERCGKDGEIKAKHLCPSCYQEKCAFKKLLDTMDFFCISIKTQEGYIFGGESLKKRMKELDSEGG